MCRTLSLDLFLDANYIFVRPFDIVSLITEVLFILSLFSLCVFCVVSITWSWNSLFFPCVVSNLLLSPSSEFLFYCIFSYRISFDSSVWFLFIYSQSLSFPSLCYCCCSVTMSCPTLRPMDCSTPGFPVLHYLSEFAQTHVHCIDDAIQLSHPLLPPYPPALSFSQHHGLFQWVGSFLHIVMFYFQSLNMNIVITLFFTVLVC